MTDLTQILDSLSNGQPQAADELLPLVYDELRRLASARLANEYPGQTLQPTALVHEAYLRLVQNSPERSPEWKGRRHFFSAAAEAMRRILVETARGKKRLKRGEGRKTEELDERACSAASPADDVLDIHEALDSLMELDPNAAEMVKLHYFAGFTFAEAADIMGVTERTTQRYWRFARTWLSRRLAGAGLTNANVSKQPVNLTFTLIYGTRVLQTTETFTYSAKQGKSGTAK